ncbi:MAG: DEAD/DEAH box helicase [Candidatus Hodarchaeota archaeon]
MPVLHCPKCGSKLYIKKGGHIWTVRCSTCVAEILVDGRNKDLFDAYEAYSKAIKDGSAISPKAASTKRRSGSTEPSDDSRRRAKRVTGRVQTKDEVDKLIREGGFELSSLSKPLRDLVEAGVDHLVSYRYMPTTDAEYGMNIDDVKIPSRLKELLAERGIDNLYEFQEIAYHRIISGENVVIAAPTAQGKTEAFIIPILKKLLVTIQESFMNPGIRALLVYPTKALARDQYEKITEMTEAAGLTVAIFDGDVSQSQRGKIYSSPPDILLTNPDVLHYHLGWDSSRLVPLLRTVQFVVLDEIHLYTGSMGANVYYVLKRLEIEAGEFQKIGASATVANPKEFADMIFDTEVSLIESNSAKRGPIHFMMYYPGNRSKYSMIVDLVGKLHRGGFKTLVFGNTHSEAEVINMLLGDVAVKSMVHRAGLSKKYRKRVEDQFKAGNLRTLVSTPTLELGIDIGDLDSVVSMIVSITRLTQRIGRAGRKGQESVAILALRENDPISSFYRHEPEKYFGDIDAAYMEPENEVVGYYQLIAAAMSGRLKESIFPRQKKILNTLENEGIVKVQDNGDVRVVDFDNARRKWRGYSIRGIGDTVQIKMGKRSLGERAMPMAAQELHPGAIYLHGGLNYMSVKFQHTSGFGRATVVPFQDRSFHTKPLYSTMPKILEVIEEKKILGMNVIYCNLEMTQTVHGYVKRETRSGRMLERIDLPSPITYKYITKGFAFRAPPPVKATNDIVAGKVKTSKGAKLLPAELHGGAFHALEHVTIESSNMLTGGSAREIGGVAMGDSGIIFVYDGGPGGNGASRLLYGRLEEAFNRVETIIKKCDCKTIDGCPLCTYSYQCGNNNSPLFKLGALDSVRQIIGKAETDVDTVGYVGYQPLV